LLRAVGLRKAFLAPDRRRIDVLRGTSLTLGASEYVAIVGRSGSGKSTLLNLIGCLDRADGGELLFRGRSLGRAPRRTLARFRGRDLGFVFQHFNLIPGLSAWENVLLAARYVGRDRSEAGRAAAALFERLGIADRARHYPPALSGGEQQRVAFCRAVLNDPALILADEPTGNLDEDNAAVIMGELRERTRTGRSAVLLVTHSADLARSADRTLQLVDGQLVEAGRDLSGPSPGRGEAAPGAGR
jgi:ABC-type lipoprotein export system ATPase subunit